MRPVWIAVPVILAIGWLDVATGPDIGLSLLYLLPITIAAWTGSKADGILSALTAAACWLGAQIAADQTLAFTLWNGFTRIVIYTATAYLVHQVRVDRNQLAEVNARLEQALQRETVLARTDAVTGLANSRAFTEQLERELARASRDERSVVLLYLDLDGFKAINDHYGHDAGDVVLRHVAAALRESVRTGDEVARIGGDEFAALLWGAGAAAAGDIATRIADRVREIGAGYSRASLGISIGVAQARPDMTADDLVREADAAMYEQKRRPTPHTGT